MLTEEQKREALAFLGRPEVEARIKEAARFAFDRKLRVIGASELPDAAKERRAEAAERAVLSLMKSTMRNVGLLYIDAGEEAALRFLLCLPDEGS